MKVIAQTSNGYIVEIETYELAKITGSSSPHADEYKNLKVKEGSTLSVHQCWEVMKHTQEIVSFSERAIENFEGQIDKLRKLKLPKFLKAGHNE